MTAESEGLMPEPKPLELDTYRTRLLELKDQLQADVDRYRTHEAVLSGGPDEPGQGQHWEHSGYGDHLADEATELFEREKAAGLEQTLREHLRQVDHALAKIEDGSYGTCESCGKPIARERLDALPEATICIDCKAKAEERHPAARRYSPGTSS